MSISPFDHPLLSGLLGDDEVAQQFLPQADFEEMNYFEEALARAEAAEGLIPEAAAEAISLACMAFEPDYATVREAAARDGVIVPEYVRQLRLRVGPPHDVHLHFGATSQDLIDTSLVRRLLPILPVFVLRIEAIVARIDELNARFGTKAIMGRTRMQDAVPITVADRLVAWRTPLLRHRDRLAELSPRLLVLQFGGAAGTLDKLGDKARAVAQRVGDAIYLPIPEHAWHSQRDNFAEFASWLSMVSGSLGKLGEDVALMAQNAIGEVTLEGGGGSSAMPHKSNPVRAEVLVALARYNATLLPAMHHALVAEQERSGAAWTLEWLTLPQMVMTTAGGLRNAELLLGQITRLGKAE